MIHWISAFFTLLLIAERSASAIGPFTLPPPPPPPPAERYAPQDLIPPSPAQFMSTVQLAIYESDPALMRRSQQLVLEQLNSGFRAWPQLEGRRYEIRTNGNEVIFYLTTNEDLRAPMQAALATMIQNLNGRVRARGRSLFYRTSPQHPIGGYLEVVVNDVHTKVRSIAAQSVPLRDVLKEMKSQLGNLSYLIPGECADRMVDWSFGEAVADEPKHVDTVISDLATLFNLKAEKKNGTYIFTGDCQAPQQRRRHQPGPGSELLTTNLFPGTQSPHHTQVYFPLLPLGQ